MFDKAISASPSFISISSYNDWGEGTQIEPARRLNEGQSTNALHDYAIDGVDDPDKYITLTRKYSNKYLHHQHAVEL